jgi:prepilin-type processing-associated H-X9-DG protein
VALIIAAFAMTALVNDGPAGEMVHCTLNLTQLNKLIYLYTSAHDGYLPAFWHERWIGELGLTGPSWEHRLPPATDERGLYPATVRNDPFSDGGLGIRPAASFLQCPLDESGWICDQGCRSSYMGLAKYGWWHRGIGDDGPAYEYHQIQEFDETTRRILLAETQPGTWQFGICGCRWHAARHPVSIVPRHYKGGSILFFDGHVDVETDPEKQRIGFWEPDYDQVTPGWKP